jgi:hypothetical protein
MSRVGLEPTTLSLKGRWSNQARNWRLDRAQDRYRGWR